VIIPIAEREKVLLFNTLRSSALILPVQIAKLIVPPQLKNEGDLDSKLRFYRRFGPTEIADSGSCTNLSELPPSVLKSFIRFGVLVEQDQERRLLDEHNSGYWNSPELNLTLSYTSACQMNCSYCFQSRHPANKHHDAAQKIATIAWLEKYLEEHPEINSIHLGLFGGEPLTDVQTANYYAGELNKLASKKGKQFAISLTSNGLNLQSDLLSTWLKLGLQNIRVTLDGPADLHDSRRPLLSGAGTFDQILKNLKSTSRLDGFAITVCINIDAENYLQVGELLDLLEEAELKQRIDVILEPVLPAATSKRAASKHDLNAHSAFLAIALRQVMARGFKTPLIPGLCKPCNFVQSHSFAVDWSGQLFPCAFSMLLPAASIGSVEQGIDIKKNAESLKARQAVEYCLKNNCAYLPICGGGCRYGAWYQYDDFQATNCQLEVLDRMLPISVPHYFRLRPSLSSL
jgi:uncharacterized protein